MDIFSIIILGLVQGVTEWIPISSKTQVTFVYLQFLNGSTSSILPILLYGHLGTLLAAGIYFRKELSNIVRLFFSRSDTESMQSRGKVGFLFTALVLTGIVGIPLLLIEQRYFPSFDAGLLYAVMGLGLIITGVLLLTHREENTKTKDEVTWKDGIITGLLQGFSTLPGISRSGTSTTGLIWRGFDSSSSFYLSFLLSIPTVIVAELFLYIGGGLTTFPVADGVLLFFVSFVTGYLTLDGLLRIVQKVNMAYVVFALGAVIILVGLFGIG